jgi:Putative peptidoglycan binding domain
MRGPHRNLRVCGGFFATVTRRMVQGRGSRGCRAPGHRRLRRVFIVVLALASVSVEVGPALGAGGGVSLPNPGQASHGSAPRKTHKTHKRRASRPRSVSGGSVNPFARRAMWIWELPNTNGGNVASIVASAKQNGVGTLMVKSSDGTGFWTSQFTPALVSTLHASGIKVCAWQYVYGTHPITEAYMGAQAVHAGADCLIIDAETEYEGKYTSAQAYMTRLRTLIGANFPLALAGFPYVDFHPAFPYSVFLGPGGAQYNVPQMYWKDIGVTVDTVFAHTYAYNEIYGRTIFPLGQVYSSPPIRQIVRFRQLSRAYGAPGISWWDWQEASAGEWGALSRPAGPLAGYAAVTTMASIRKGDQGDLVVWAQEHLAAAGQQTGVDGGFGATTQTAVANFQAAHGLAADGIIGPQTWSALLSYRPISVVWGATGAKTHSVRALASGVGGSVRYAAVPKSASRPARRNEIAGAGGAGGHPGH